MARLDQSALAHRIALPCLPRPLEQPAHQARRALGGQSRIGRPHLPGRARQHRSDRGMTRYAATTEVSSSRSRDEIERTLTRYGADQFLYGWQETSAVVGFRMHGRQIKFMLPLPDRN